MYPSHGVAEDWFISENGAKYIFWQGWDLVSSSSRSLTRSLTEALFSQAVSLKVGDSPSIQFPLVESWCSLYLLLSSLHCQYFPANFSIEIHQSFKMRFSTCVSALAIAAGVASAAHHRSLQHVGKADRPRPDHARRQQPQGQKETRSSAFPYLTNSTSSKFSSLNPLKPLLIYLKSTP